MVQRQTEAEFQKSLANKKQHTHDRAQKMLDEVDRAQTQEEVDKAIRGFIDGVLVKGGSGPVRGM